MAEGPRVGDLGEVTLGRQRSPGHMTGLHTTPYLRVANVFLDRIDYSDVLSMDFTPTEREKFYVDPGDILLNEGQSLELVGRSAVYRGEPRRFCFQNTLVRFRANRERLEPDYAQLLFEQWLKRGDFQKVAFRTTSIAHLGADRFARMALNVPTLEEQRERLAPIQAVSDRITAESDLLEGLRQTRAGLAADLLSGRIRTVAA